ncbi:MAG: STAS domain-containing protein [Planctomycetaceae bacterium]|nr:STAS domain-containing protein [Planctomycetaceae bacterium]
MMQLTEYNPAYFELDIDGDVAIAAFQIEQLTEDDNLEQFGQELFALVDQYQFRKVLVQLAPVRFVTSSVLGKLITLHRKLGRNDGQLVLCNIHDDLREVLNTSRLLTYFSTAEDVPAAMAALR